MGQSDLKSKLSKQVSNSSQEGQNQVKDIPYLDESDSQWYSKMWDQLNKYIYDQTSNTGMNPDLLNDETNKIDVQKTYEQYQKFMKSQELPIKRQQTVKDFQKILLNINQDQLDSKQLEEKVLSKVQENVDLFQFIQDVIKTGFMIQVLDNIGFNFQQITAVPEVVIGIGGEKQSISLELKDTGDITITSQGNVTINQEGDVSINSSGNTNIVQGENVSIQGGQVSVTQDSVQFSQ